MNKRNLNRRDYKRIRALRLEGYNKSQISIKLNIKYNQILTLFKKDFNKKLSETMPKKSSFWNYKNEIRELVQLGYSIAEIAQKYDWEYKKFLQWFNRNVYIHEIKKITAFFRDERDERTVFRNTIKKRNKRQARRKTTIKKNTMSLVCKKT
jgi:hypothetical protein